MSGKVAPISKILICMLLGLCVWIQAWRAKEALDPSTHEPLCICGECYINSLNDE